MSKKLSIKPVHLVIIGLAILVLGILVPSFFISPTSTIGLSIIMGSVILLSAYAFFSVNVIKSKGKKSIKWLVLPVILALLVGGGFFAYNKQYIQDLPIIIPSDKQKEAIASQISIMVDKITAIYKEIESSASTDKELLDREAKVYEEKTDKLVYDLYEITEEEKEIIEEVLP